jgi:predicted AlkP superfamily phosphohydrolase/phosphomutase
MASSNLKPASRVLIIGLDGATWDLLEPLIKSGHLPNLEGLINSGTKGILESTIPPVTASAWSSFYTGRTPGHHGVYDFRRRMSSDSTDREWVTSGSIGGPKLWEIVNAQGKKVGLVNLPLTFPPVKVDGYMIGGMPVPPARDEIGYPKGLVDEIIRETGEYISDVDLLRGVSPDVKDPVKCGEFVEQVSRATEVGGKAVKYLMGKYPTDLTFFVLVAPDRLSHLFWQVLVPSKSDSGLDKWELELKTKMLGVLRKVDEVVGDIAGSMTDEDLIVVMSDHGFGPLKEILKLNKLLSEIGFLKFRPEVEGGLKKRIGRALPESVKKPLRAMFGMNGGKGAKGSGGESRFDPYSLIDWKNTRAYSGGGVEQGIFLNIAGREPYGTVQLGAEYYQVREKLISELKKINHPGDSKPLFDWVEPRENIYSGEYLENAPDIMYGLRGYTMVIGEDAEPPMVGPWSQPRAGFHRREGILVLKGPMIGKGITLTKKGIENIAPTILRCWGLKLDKGMDGQVIDEAVDEGFLLQNPEQRESFEVHRKQAGPSCEDSQEMEDLLKGLGYLN